MVQWVLTVLTVPSGEGLNQDCTLTVTVSVLTTEPYPILRVNTHQALPQERCPIITAPASSLMALQSYCPHTVLTCTDYPEAPDGDLLQRY